MMSLQQIAALAVLFHLLYYVASRGWTLATTNFLPVFGIDTPKKIKTSIVCVTIVSCTLSLFFNNLATACLMVSSLSAYVLTTTFRLSNHIFIAYLISILGIFDVYSSDGKTTIYSQFTAFSLIISVYIFSLIHKLNREFLSSESSSALVMCDRFFIEFRNNAARSLVPLFILASYVTIPIFLIHDDLFSLGMATGLVLHVLYGMSGNPHFSFLMALLYFQFQDFAQLQLEILAPAVLAAALSIWKFQSAKTPWVFQYKKIGTMLIFILNTFIFTLILSLVFAPVSYSPDFHQLLDSQILALCAVGAIMTLNCLSPYLFGKSEFCLSMFSNLRIDQNNHLFLKNRKIAGEYKRDYHVIRDVINLDRARLSDVRMIRHLSYLLDRRNKYMYSAYFIMKARKFLDEHGLNEILLITEKPLGGRTHSMILKPYMLPIDKFSGIMG